METHILPMYANTHSKHSAASKQTNQDREEARAIIKQACNANEQDALIFIGNGCTSAVHLLVGKLKIKEKCEALKAQSQQMEETDTTVQDSESSVSGLEEASDAAKYCKPNHHGMFDCTICK